MDDVVLESEPVAQPSAVSTAIERQTKWLADSIEEAIKLIEPQQRLLAAETDIGIPFDAVDVCWNELQAVMTVKSSEEIVEVLRVLANHGFRRRDKAAPVRNDYDPTRVAFALEKLTLTVVNKGATCRRVKTGEKLIDVYEVVCDDPTEEVEHAIIGGSPNPATAEAELAEALKQQTM